MITVHQLELNGTVWWVPEDEFPHIHSDGPERFKSLIGFMYRFQYQEMLDATMAAIKSIESGTNPEGVIGADDFCVFFYAHNEATGLNNVAELIFLWEKENFYMMPTDSFVDLIDRLVRLRPTSEPSPITTRIYDLSSEYRRPDSVYEYDDDEG